MSPASALLYRAGSRFVLVGALNTALTWCVFALLVIWLPHQPALALAYGLGILIAWIGNSRWVFNSRGTAGSMLVYPLIYLLTWGCNALVLEALLAVGGFGPRLGQALALLLIVPISFALNAALLGPAAGRWRERVILTLPVLVLPAVVFAPLLGGFWLSDDLGNLNRAFNLAADDQLLGGTLTFLSQPVDSPGTFYRPVMIASVSALYAVFGAWYPGWAAASLILHLLASLLVAMLVRRLLGWCAAESSGFQRLGAPVLAGLAFALCPLIVEGVAWISARADPGVTVLGLLAAWFWAGPAHDPARRHPATDQAGTGRGAWMLPVLLLPALGFKESAVILPLQVLMLALLWPRRPGRHRIAALGVALGLAAAFLLWRAWFFGSATEIYSDSASATIDWRSPLAWWQAYFDGQATAAMVWLTSLAGLAGFGLVAATDRARRLALALLCAGGGLFLATLLNLGELADNGEGGRLLHSPLAWAMVGLGLALGSIPGRPRVVIPAVMMALVVTLGGWLSHQQTSQFRQVQDGFRVLAGSLPEHAGVHPGLSIVLIPDSIGFVVAGRNAQGGLAMPPLQSEPLLHRTLPTLTREWPVRLDQLESGLATRLAAAPPRRIDPEHLAELLDPADYHPPEWLACWKPEAHELISRPAPEAPSDLDRTARALIDECRH